MEQLTPELERQLQVEELWARRKVLADAMNAQRRQRFYAQHTRLTQFGTVPTVADAPQTASDAAEQDQIEETHAVLQLGPALVVAASSPPAPAAACAPRKSRHSRRWIAMPAMAASILMLVSVLAVTNLASFPGAQAMAYLAPAAPVQAAAASAVLPPVQHADLKAEVAATIAASVGSHAHDPQVLQALRSAPDGNAVRWN